MRLKVTFKVTNNMALENIDKMPKTTFKAEEL